MRSNYSLNRRDKKVAGVCSTLGDIFNVDPTILRIGFVAIAIMISWELALIAYIGGGIYLHMQKNKAGRLGTGKSDFERMEDFGTVRPTVHAMRTELDETDRRMMAIDHHIASQKDHELAREIDALREEK
ncbi:MAG: PspC domain-containing protein [Sphingomonas bacterium]|nr:PspC domain-containing protein [Sphingomonas bacterium]